MTVRLAHGLLARLERAADAARPNEACALLLGDAKVDTEISDVAFSDNVTGEDPQTSFEIDPALHFQLQRAARAGGPAVLGVWHSHPNGVAAPSAVDRERSLMPGWVWLITVPGGVTRAYRAAQDDPHELLPVPLATA